MLTLLVLLHSDLEFFPWRLHVLAGVSNIVVSEIYEDVKRGEALIIQGFSNILVADTKNVL